MNGRFPLVPKLEFGNQEKFFTFPSRLVENEFGHVRRIILLGASNLTMAFPRLLSAVENAYDGPLEIFAALGHGRSYGMWSRVLHRSLPGIVGSGLWQAVESREEQPVETLGLITDVGNDVLYGASVTQIIEWVETCLSRMKDENADVALTLLPIENVERLGAWRYYAVRKLLFPRSRLSLCDVRHLAHELNERLMELASKYESHTIEQPVRWYGLDPIHFRPTRRREAWRCILSGWPSFPPNAATGQARLAKRLRLFQIQPEVRRVFGRERTTRQPVHRSGQVSVSLY